MLSVKKHIQNFYNQTILDRNVGRGGEGAATEYYVSVAAPSPPLPELSHEYTLQGLKAEYILDTYMVRWYYIYRGATDRRLALKFVDYKSNRQSFEARAVIFVLIYCSENQWYTQEQNRWCTSGRAALQPSRGFRGISSPEGLRYSTVPLTAAPSCVGRPCRLRGTQQTGSTSVIGKPVYAGGPLRAGAGDGREGGALPHTPASP